VDYIIFVGGLAIAACAGGMAADIPSLLRQARAPVHRHDLAEQAPRGTSMQHRRPAPQGQDYVLSSRASGEAPSGDAALVLGTSRRKKGVLTAVSTPRKNVLGHGEGENELPFTVDGDDGGVRPLWPAAGSV